MNNNLKHKNNNKKRKVRSTDYNYNIPYNFIYPRNNPFGIVSLNYYANTGNTTPENISSIISNIISPYHAYSELSWQEYEWDRISPFDLLSYEYIPPLEPDTDLIIKETDFKNVLDDIYDDGQVIWIDIDPNEEAEEKEITISDDEVMIGMPATPNNYRPPNQPPNNPPRRNNPRVQRRVQRPRAHIAQGSRQNYPLPPNNPLLPNNPLPPNNSPPPPPNDPSPPPPNDPPPPPQNNPQDAQQQTDKRYGKFVTFISDQSYEYIHANINKSPELTEYGHYYKLPNGSAAGALVFSSSQVRASLITGSVRYGNNVSILNDLNATIRTATKGRMGNYWYLDQKKEGYKEWCHGRDRPFNDKPSEDLVIDIIRDLVLNENMVNYSEFSAQHFEWSCQDRYKKAFYHALDLKRYFMKLEYDEEQYGNLELRPFQQHFMDKFERDLEIVDARGINFIKSPGDFGKTVLCNAARAKWPDNVLVLPSMAKSSDVAHIIRHKIFTKILLIDVPRNEKLDKDTDMSIFEELKNALIVCPKYDSGIIALPLPVHIYFFSNSDPYPDWFSWDRWKALLLKQLEDEVVIEPLELKWTSADNCPPGYVIESNPNNN